MTKGFSELATVSSILTRIDWTGLLETTGGAEEGTLAGALGREGTLGTVAVAALVTDGLATEMAAGSAAALILLAEESWVDMVIRCGGWL